MNNRKLYDNFFHTLYINDGQNIYISITLTIISFIEHNDHQYQIPGFLRPKAISV